MSRSSASRSAVHAVVVAMLLGLTLVAGSQPATAASTATLGGHVTKPEGGSTEGATVGVYVEDDGYWDRQATVTVGAGNSWSVQVEPGTYLVRVDAVGTYDPRWFGGSYSDRTATRVTVADGATRSDLDILVGYDPDRATLAGVVTRPSGTAVAGQQVLVERYREDWRQWISDDVVATGADGGWRAGVGPGTYRVRLSDFGRWDMQWFPGVFSEGSATSFPVAAGTRQLDIDFVTAQDPSKATLSGTVRTPAGFPVEDAEVRVYRMSSGSWWFTNDSAQTDDAGHWSVRLPEGTYRIGVTVGDGHGYRSTFYGDVSRVTEAADVTAEAGAELTGLDVVLARGPAGTLSGSVTATGGGALEGVLVTAYELDRWGWSPVGQTETRPDGSWAIDLLQGTYRLGFSGPGRIDEYFDDATTILSARDVLLAAGQTTGALDAVLAADPGLVRLSGTVTSSLGGPLDRAEVVVERLEDGDWDYVAHSYPRASGEWTTFVPPGPYRLRFLARGHLPQFYAGASSPDEASTVQVWAGQPRGGLDAVLAAEPDRTIVSGTVSLPDGSGSHDAKVRLYRATGEADRPWRLVSKVGTDAQGHWSAVVATGEYRMRVDRSGFDPQFHQGRWTWQEAEAFAVTATGVTGLDTTLGRSPSRGVLQGTLTGPSGEPVERVWIAAHQLVEGQWKVTRSTFTGPGGHWQMRIEAGTYRVGFAVGSGEDRLWVPEYDADAATLASGTDVVVPAQGTSTRDAVLAAAPRTGLLAGRVTQAGAPAAGATVDIYRFDEDRGWSRAWTIPADQDGKWFRRAPAGVSYRVRFTERDGSGPTLARVWFGGTPTSVGATVIPLATGETRPAVDGVLPGGTPSVTNTVLPTVSGTPKVGVLLTANVGTWAPTDVTTSIQWLRGQAVVGTGPTYTPAAADLGATLRIRVTASEVGYKDAVGESQPTTPVLLGGPVVNTKLPTLSGSSRVGSTLTARPGSWSPAVVAPTYQWLRAGVVVPGAVRSTYVLTKADAGRRMSVRVTASQEGYGPRVAVSAPTSVVKATPRMALGLARSGSRTLMRVVVAAAVPVTGSVRFYDGGRLLTSVALRAGSANHIVRLARGRHTVKVVYLGSTTVAGGTMSKTYLVR